MPTHRLAFPADYHYPVAGSTSRFTDAMDRLMMRSPDTIVWGGDQVASNQKNPDVRESEVREFWDYAKQHTNLDITHQIPGNHDGPTQFWHNVTEDYLPTERTDLPRKIQPVDGLTALLVDTNGASRVQGGGIGVGVSSQYLPLKELEWMIAEIDAAHNRGDVVVICAHGPFWPLPHDCTGNGFNRLNDLSTYSIQDVSLPMMSTSAETDLQGQSYFICRNYHQIIQELVNHGPTVILTGHLKRGSSDTRAEGYQNINNSGVYQTWQTHFAGNDGTEAAYLDIDTSTGQVQMYTIPFGGGSDNLIMDITPSW